MKPTLTRSMLLLLAPALISCAGAKEGQQSERPVLAGVKTVLFQPRPSRSFTKLWGRFAQIPRR